MSMTVEQELGCSAYSMLPQLLISLHKSEIQLIRIIYAGRNSKGDAITLMEEDDRLEELNDITLHWWRQMGQEKVFQEKQRV